MLRETPPLRALLLSKAEGPGFISVLGETVAGEGLVQSLLTRDPRSSAPSIRLDPEIVIVTFLPQHEERYSSAGISGGKPSWWGLARQGPGETEYEEMEGCVRGVGEMVPMESEPVRQGKEAGRLTGWEDRQETRDTW